MSTAAPVIVMDSDGFGGVVNININCPDYGFIRVSQKVCLTTEDGWHKYPTKQALIVGKLDELIAAGFLVNMMLPGKIVTRESFRPFNPSRPAKYLKTAGKTGIVCSVNGAPIYRKNFYTTNPLDEEFLIAHTNTAEISNALKELRKVGL